MEGISLADLVVFWLLRKWCWTEIGKLCECIGRPQRIVQHDCMPVISRYILVA